MSLIVAVPAPVAVILNFIVVSVVGTRIVLIVGVLYCEALLGGVPLPDQFNGTNAADAPFANVALDELTIPITKNGLELSLKFWAENEEFINQADPEGRVTQVLPERDNPFDACTVSYTMSVFAEAVIWPTVFIALIYLGAFRL